MKSLRIQPSRDTLQSTNMSLAGDVPPNLDGIVPGRMGVFNGYVCYVSLHRSQPPLLASPSDERNSRNRMSLCLVGKIHRNRSFKEIWMIFPTLKFNNSLRFSQKVLDLSWLVQFAVSPVLCHSTPCVVPLNSRWTQRLRSTCLVALTALWSMAQRSAFLWWMPFLGAKERS